jgi:hypothetical protein
LGGVLNFSTYIFPCVAHGQQPAGAFTTHGGIIIVTPYVL